MANAIKSFTNSVDYPSITKSIAENALSNLQNSYAAQMANISFPDASAELSALTDNLHLHQPSIYDTINSYRNISTLYGLESTAAAAAQADMNLYNSNDSENSDAPEKDVNSNIYNDDKNE